VGSGSAGGGSAVGLRGARAGCGQDWLLTKGWLVFGNGIGVVWYRGLDYPGWTILAGQRAALGAIHTLALFEHAKDLIGLGLHFLPVNTYGPYQLGVTAAELNFYVFYDRHPTIAPGTTAPFCSVGFTCAVDDRYSAIIHKQGKRRTLDGIRAD
jgi:hypothetical protein